MHHGPRTDFPCAQDVTYASILTLPSGLLCWIVMMAQTRMPQAAAFAVFGRIGPVVHLISSLPVRLGRYLKETLW